MPLSGDMATRPLRVQWKEVLQTYREERSLCLGYRLHKADLDSSRALNTHVRDQDQRLGSLCPAKRFQEIGTGGEEAWRADEKWNIGSEGASRGRGQHIVCWKQLCSGP